MTISWLRSRWAIVVSPASMYCCGPGRRSKPHRGGGGRGGGRGGGGEWEGRQSDDPSEGHTKQQRREEDQKWMKGYLRGRKAIKLEGQGGGGMSEGENRDTKVKTWGRGSEG